MQTVILAALFAMLGGVAITVQNAFANNISAKTTAMGSTFFIHLGGTIASAILIFVFKKGSIEGWQNVPWYALMGGVMGLIIISSIVYSIPRIGVAGAVSAQLVAMLIGGALVDHFGLFGTERIPITITKVIGMVILMAGAVLVVKK